MLWIGTFLLLVGAARGADIKDTGKVMMWEVRSDNATAYILGSIHLGSEEMYPLNAAIEDAYAAGDTLVLEVDMNAANQLKAATLVMQEGMYQGTETLSANLSSETLAKLDAFLKARKMQVAAVDRMKPWLATMMLAMQELMSLGFSPDQGIDMHFFQKAGGTGKPVVGLETPEEQVKILSSGLAYVQDKELAEFLDDAGKLREIYNEMLAAWLAGDAADMKRIIDENLSDDPKVKAFSDNVIDGRSATMADRIAGLMASGKKPFIIIGSGHLVGDKSVPALLKARGFTVTQVDKKSAAAAPAPAMESTATAAK